MATKQNSNEQERVEIFIPRAPSGDDTNFFVSVNEYTAVLPRGQKSSVPAFIADEINRALQAEDRFYKKCDEKEFRE